MRVTEARSQRDNKFKSTGHTENYAHTAAVIGAISSVTGITESLAGRHKPKELGGVDSLQGSRGNVEFHRVKRD